MKQYKKLLIKKINEGFFRAKIPGYKALKNDCTAEQVFNLLELADKTDIELFYTVHDLFEICVDNKGFTPLSKTLIGVINDLDHYDRKFVGIHRFLPMDVVEVLRASKNSCLVGGCVRDTLINKEPKDFDFVTDIAYDDLERLFVDAGFTVKEAGKQFLVLIVTKDGVDYEIANFRKDGTYVDGRRPESVEIGTIYDDAERRDFTVNALYLNLTDIQLIDPTGQGIDDIKEKTLRFVGKPKDRIEQDFLRVFRFYRFLDKGFTPESNSLSAVREFFSEAYTKTAPERIRVELERITMKG
jgi:hypothetical protein